MSSQFCLHKLLHLEEFRFRRFTCLPFKDIWWHLVCRFSLLRRIICLLMNFMHFKIKDVPCEILMNYFLYMIIVKAKILRWGKMLRHMKRHVCTIIDHTYIVLVFLFLSKAKFLCATIKRLIYKWPHRCFFANDLKHVSGTAKLLSIKLYSMSKTGYRQVYDIQDKLF